AHAGRTFDEPCRDFRRDTLSGKPLGQPRDTGIVSVRATLSVGGEQQPKRAATRSGRAIGIYFVYVKWRLHEQCSRLTLSADFGKSLLEQTHDLRLYI